MPWITRENAIGSNGPQTNITTLKLLNNFSTNGTWTICTKISSLLSKFQTLLISENSNLDRAAF